MAVTKTLPVEAVSAAYSLGFRHFGENRVLEALEKFETGVYQDSTLDLIGHLQTNKAKKAAEIFQGVQTLDSETTARELSRRALQAEKNIEVLIEYNTSGEAQKDGLQSWKELILLAGLLQSLPNITLKGLMTMAAFTSEEKIVRKCFAQLKELKTKIETELKVHLPVLSMGMSQDYPWAIMEGSTLIRIGTALFGGRK